MQNQKKIRNIAIVAHVDHGKTTLVDRMLQTGGLFRVRAGITERIMDSNDQERERGITILSKNTAVHFLDHKINIIDTPGHSDFGGEVERVLSMADGILLLVDAKEGPMPQTRFVLRKALERHLQPIVVINKIDRPDQRAEPVLNEVFDLFCELTHDDRLLEFPVIFASARDGIAKRSMGEASVDLKPLFEDILARIPAPKARDEEPAQFQVSLLDYNSFVGKIGIGRVHRGSLRVGMQVSRVRRDLSRTLESIQELYTFQGLERIKVDRVECGDIAAVVGIEDLEISDTLCDPAHPEALPAVTVELPTMSMIFKVNDSPFAGTEGTFVTSRHLRERLEREVMSNVALRVEPTQDADTFNVSGRGVLHLSVLIETMRREGYEFAVGKPRVIVREVDGISCEPIEMLLVDVRSEFAGKVIELVGMRRGEVARMEVEGVTTHLEISIPARGLVGLRTRLLTATQGEAVLHHSFLGYEPFRGAIPGRSCGVQVSMDTGEVVFYALESLKDRGDFFVKPGDRVYGGQVVGEHCRGNDIVVNPLRAKKLTNMRAAGSDRKLYLPPARLMTLEEALEYIADDELVEVTPRSIRLRKMQLDEKQRKRARAVLLV